MCYLTIYSVLYSYHIGLFVSVRFSFFRFRFFISIFSFHLTPSFLTSTSLYLPLYLCLYVHCILTLLRNFSHSIRKNGSCSRILYTIMPYHSLFFIHSFFLQLILHHSYRSHPLFTLAYILTIIILYCKKKQKKT